jgi:Ricin-type beta-trefoil lectin domain-like
MPGKRDARSRTRGSWAARLTGIGLAILLAGVALAVYLVVGNRAHHSPGLPTRVLGTEAVNLVNPGPPPAGGASASPETFLASRTDLSFTAGGQAEADWTADQMAGGTYIFIYLPDGSCLTAARSSAVTLARCNLGASQRWVRQHLVSSGGLDYWQLRSLSRGRCLTAAAGNAAGTPAQSAARLDPCLAPPDWSQLVAFVTAS